MKIDCRFFFTHDSEISKSMTDCELELNILGNEKKIIVTKGDDNYSFEISGKIIARSDLEKLSLDFNLMEKHYYFKFKENDGFLKLKKWLAESKSEIENDSSIKRETKEVKNLIAESFSTDLLKNEYVGVYAQTFLGNQIRKFINGYNKHSHYGPFTMVCQSSGFGKSRSCLSLVDENFYVVYCCLRDQKSTGYPLRSLYADFLMKKNDLRKNFNCFFKIFIDIANDSKLNSKDFFDFFGAKREKSLVELLYENIKDTKEITVPIYTGETPLVFIFDEASTLLPDNYFTIRSLLNGLEKNIFVLFLDTFSQLSDFMPSKYLDPSERVAEMKLKLFEPIYLLPTWDVYVNSKYENIKNINDSIMFENICAFGRPLWGAWIHTKHNSHGNLYESIPDKYLFDLAVKKLIGGKNIRDELNRNDCLAVLSSRIGTIVPKQITTSQELVAMNMAVCMYVETTKNTFEIDYPSEPILAIAGALVMEENFGFILDNLIKSVESNLISQGEKGEMIAKLILIKAIDKAVKVSGISHSSIKCLNYVQVGTFIQSLYGKCFENCGSSNNNWKCKSLNQYCCLKIVQTQIQNSERLLDGFVNFNHFTKPECSMSEISLKDALKRCSAIHCKKNQKSIDLIIPIALNNMDLNSISAIMVQVKLYEEAPEPNYVNAFLGVSSKMFFDLDNDSPYLMLYIQLGGGEKHIRDIKENLTLRGEEYKKQAIIYSEGISKNIFPNLDKGTDELLKTFSFTERKLFDLRDSIEIEKSKIYQATLFSLRKKERKNERQLAKKKVKKIIDP